MKKIFLLLLVSFLVLAACGNKEESKSEDKKETKSSKKDDKKSNDGKKSNDSKKTDSEKDESDEKVVTQDGTTQTQEQANTQEQTPTQQEPTEQEKMEANAKVAKQHGYTGIPNGDAGMLDENYSPEDNSEQTYDYENNGVQRTPSEQKAHEDWVNGQDEWMKASESEREEIRKADAEKYGYEYDPNDYEE
ncbi:hypothetical protein QI089_09455 [Staphylococcus saprophyticus]|uniref:hypothetical protein n=1 Tax=Staphylococcus saprophyticus TaxID=29385 RepID=UPI001887B64D|nr:hypothetical protein [Staphylococcus saprophyticus]MBF2777845.1 hypothetical protein [Staphylococcus saprophyticus]MDW4357180.1 hypothetical protein [Staphylococcus saprophyticus]MEB7677499.1 hypothetical protein [Staphylococcus saprophyticus]